MSDDVTDLGVVTTKRKRRRLSALERMAKKVNEMRIVPGDERLVIINTICNVESNDALSKFMTIDGHVLLATWLNEACTQSHVALQMAMLKLAARLPISGNMSTAIEAIVSELALKCPDNEIRELAKFALSQWQSVRPGTKHFTITIGDNKRKVVFEHDPAYHSSTDDDEPIPKKSKSNRKTLQWAPEHRLEMVRVFHSPLEEKQPSSASSSKSKASRITAQASWSCPPSLIIPEDCIFRDYASQSIEAKVQGNRAASLMEVVYFKKDQIPPNPLPPSQTVSLSSTAPYSADLRNLPPPAGGMKSGMASADDMGLDLHENALALEELISADPGLVDDLLEHGDIGLESADADSFGFGRIRSPPPSTRRDRARSPPPMDLNLDHFGLPLPPSSRADWPFHPHRNFYAAPPEHPPFDHYGVHVYREHPPYMYDHDQRRRSPPRPIPPPYRPVPYNDFNGSAPHDDRYEEFRLYPDQRFTGRVPERRNDFRDRPPSPFRGEMFPSRSFEERRSGRICRFYQMPRGCTLGDKCTFLHDNPVSSKGLQGPHRNRPRPKGKGRGAPASNEAARPPADSFQIETETEGEFDQFGRLRKSALVTPPTAQ